MAAYKTPAVYIEEIASLPPSVAAVSTAIPAFLGYTEQHAGKGAPQVAQVSTLLEYISLFGGPQKLPIEVSVTGNTVTPKVSAPSFLLYYSLSHYFLNGGGPCYIVSLGDYSAGSPKHDDFVDGLAALEKEDEPTLILLTDAVTLSAAEYYDLCQQALAQCNKLGDLFCIFDVKDKPTTTDRGVQDFRDLTGTNYLKYGAAYHPYLKTTLSIQYSDDQVTVDGGDASNHNWQKTLDPKGVTISFLGTGSPTASIVQDATATTPAFVVSRSDLTIKAASAPTGTAMAGAWVTFKSQQNVMGWDVAVAGMNRRSSNSNRTLHWMTKAPRPLRCNRFRLQTLRFTNR